MAKPGENVMLRKDFLNLAAASKQKPRRDKLIALANSDEIESVIEIVTNLLEGNIDLDSLDKSKLKRYVTVLRDLKYCKRGNKRLQHKKRLLIQKGGFLPLLIPLALSAISKIILRNRLCTPMNTKTGVLQDINMTRTT